MRHATRTTATRTIDMLTDESRRMLCGTAVAAAGILLVGLLATPERIWSNLLVGTFFLVTLALGGTVFLALTTVMGAGWHVAFRRVPEAFAKTLPLLGVAILVVLAPKMQSYGWHHHGDSGPGTFWFKELWLSPPFWLARSVGYVVVWALLGGWLTKLARVNSETGSANRGREIRLAAVFLVVYAVTFSLASADWLMALEPMWFSTIWGVYNFSGMILATLAAMVILSVVASEPGRRLHGIFSDEHLHDLGKLLIGFSCFWMYIWFSQYMLIWYSNIPEETSYFMKRMQGPWTPVVVMSIVLNWVLPFFVLLPRPSKRSRKVMVRVSIVLLLGRWVDLVVMVFPSTLGNTPLIGVWEVAALVGASCMGILLLTDAFCKGPPAPTSDPYFQESLSYHA